MEEKKVADYFVVAGLPNEPELLDSNFISEGQPKTRHNQTPIVEIGVIFPSLNEKLPEGWEIINHTPSGLNADLNHGSLRTNESYICYKRGTEKPPLVDIGIMYEGKEYLMSDAEIVKESVGGNVANVNNSTSRIFITYRRGLLTMPCNALVVTDICVVIASKGESPPHAFCCINKNLNKGIVGSDVFLCYKKSMNKAKSITYKPEILSRYPMKDSSDFLFPNSVPLFCLPMGATLEVWPKEASRPKPVYSSFVLTVSDAKLKIYGSAITFYEEFPKNQLTKEQKEILEYEDDSDKVLNVNKSICVLSHWPFSDTFMSWLYFLYDVVCGNKPQLVPIESYIVQLIDEVPFPKPRTLLQLSMQHPFDKAIFTQPEDLPLPRSAAKFRELLANLGPENCLQVLLLILTEQKILIHSLRPDTLTSVAEAVSSLLFPFKWQCPYIPLCPLGLVEVLHAPLPFLVGVDSRFFDFHDPPPDVSCVDLDTNIITVAEHQRQLLSVKLLPKRAAKCLKATLEAIYHRLRLQTESNEHSPDENIETEFLKRKKEQAIEFEIMEAFVKFMVLILKGYKSYLLPITKAPTIGTTDTKALFQLSDFLRSRDKSNQKFFSLLVKTQMFSRFIEERSFVDDDQGLSFFDECIELMSEEMDVKLIEHDGVVKSDKTNFILPPEPILTTAIVYKNFTLNESLMQNKKKSHLSSVLNNNSFLPGSPMARRTNHEIKTAQKLAKKCSRSPDLWAKCLCGACHTLYFMMLPSVLALNPTKEKIVLQQAYELLVRATHLRLACDEICYRLMIQLCGEHSRPLLAVKLLVLMKKFGLQPNALTYGLYNRCVLEAEWPAHSSSSQLLWNKLRNVVIGAAHFKWAAKRKNLRNSTTSIDGVSSLEPNDRTPSHSSLDSHENLQSESLLEKLGRNIFRGNIYGSFQSVSDNVDTAPNEDKEIANCCSSNESFIEPELLPDGTNDEVIKSVKGNNLDESKCNIIGTENERRIVHSNNFSLSSCLKLSDPLGALDDEDEQFTVDCIPQAVSSNTQEPSKPFNTNGDLYEPTTIKKSATFENSPTNNKLIRSETVPASTVASSLASLGSSIKIGFSTTSLASKKSNELIQGGLSSIKSAANSMVKKLDEIKEAISTSATSTPVKHRNGDSSYFSYEDGANERVRKISTEFDSTKVNCSPMKDIEEKLPSSLYPCPNEKHPGSELDICLTSCSQCHHCMNILYDEDIMAHWFAEDSNLNTICQNCDKPTVPLLTITIMGTNLPVCDPFSVPYLNPLVLRKELENIIFQEGDLCLTEFKFITDHPIIYWNLVWAFERINLQTFLPNLYLKTKIGKRKSENCEEPESLDGSYMQPVEAGTDPLSQELVVQEQLSIPVSVTCLWDQPRIHGDKPPMYVFWDHRDFSSSTPKMMSKIFMQNIISYIRLNDLTEPIKLLVAEREKITEEIVCNNRIPYPLYRDILFLACKALGRGQVDLNMFDKEYFSSYTRLTERPENKSFSKSVRKQDKPICLNSLYCRQYFKPLTLP
ncbi:DENN domain-containing protein Crag [Harmonia axyridis]|uniref:DENN domain-containing protein Crag n=1 Tax=Harmonia axyridis TaxID=115357 RepID=UPI001E2794A1|nr:DENN domain-containing protein Crag [Harmonia axyridis]